MSRGSRQGPTVHVQRALGWNGAPSVAMRSETAPCPYCGAELRFVTGEYGQTLEICTSREPCAGRTPHRVIPDLSQLKEPWVPKKRRRVSPPAP